jgi:hypothetical protein
MNRGSAVSVGVTLLVLVLTAALATSPPQVGPSATITSPLANIADRCSSEREIVSSIGQLGTVTESVAFWRQIAADARYSKAHRRHAIFQLFSRHVPEKTTLSDLAVKLHGAPWLQAANIQKMAGLSGPWPFDPGENDSVFCFYTLSPQPPYWIISLHLSNDINQEDMVRLVHGGATH